MMDQDMHQTTVTDNLQVAMIQDGARRRYALPATLHQAGNLAVMYTDFFIRPRSLENTLINLSGLLGRKRSASLAGRTHPQLQSALVRTFPLTMMRHRRMASRFASEADYYQQVAADHAKIICKQGFADANLLLGFIRNMHPNLLAEAHRRGLVTVGDQIIAPAAQEIAEAQKQTQRWPGWQDGVLENNVQAFVDFEKQSWAHLDHILSMSEYVKQGLIEQGVDEKKITLLPYPIDIAAYTPPDRSTRDPHRPITIGFVGAVNLRKGAPEFMHVAKRFDPQQVKFKMIGTNHLNPDMLLPFTDHVQWIGKVPRSKIADYLGQFDLFFFPTTCEGSAGSVAEAMAMGLPVVTTPNAGSQVRDGIEGRIVSCGDMDGYHEAMADLIADRDKRLAMGNAARDRAMLFDRSWYQQTLVSTLESFRHA